MKHIKIVLAPDQRYPGPRGCGSCVYFTGHSCGEPYHVGTRLGSCVSYKGHWTVKASVSRNKREGKYRLQWIPYRIHPEYGQTHRRTMSRGHHG